MAKTFEIPADHPALPGHFPGRPIVPGVVLLQAVIEAAGAHAPGREIAGVRRMKFQRPLQPEEPVSVEFEPPASSGMRFRVRSGETPVADGQLVFRQPG